MMVQINVKRPVAVPHHEQRAIDLKPGVHEIHRSLLDHWYVKALMKEGVISIVQKAPKTVFKPLPVEEKKPAPVVNNYRPVVSQIIVNNVDNNAVQEIPQTVKDVVEIIKQKQPEPVVEEKVIVEEKAPIVVEENKVPTKTIKRRKKA